MLLSISERRSYIIFSFLLLFNVAGFSQTGNRLEILVNASKENLPVLKQKQAQYNAARARVTDVRHSFLPQVRFSEQVNLATDNSLAGSFFTFGITPSTSAGVRPDNNAQAATGNMAVLYSEYELVNFGLNASRIKNAEAFVDLQSADLQKEQYLVSLQVSRLYFNAMKVQYRLDADRQNVNRYDSIFRIIHALTVSGLKPGSDTSLAKAELSKARITLIQTKGLLSQLKEQLAYYTGVPADKIAIDSAAGSFLNRTPMPLPVPADTVPNPLVDYYTVKKNIFLANEELIRKSYLPKIMLAGSLWARGSSIQFNDNYKSLGTGLGYQRYNYAIGVAFTYNLFNGLFKKDRLAINRFDIQASDYEMQQQLSAVQSSSRQADNALTATSAALRELPEQLTAARQTYLQKTAQYKAGIISLIDLTNASFVLYRSQTDYIETMSDWYLAQLDKAVATGNLYPFIQTIK